jgi:hypothetical protein
MMDGSTTSRRGWPERLREDEGERMMSAAIEAQSEKNLEMLEYDV